MSSARARRNQPWHGTFEIDPETAGFWRIGPLHLWAYRAVKEWRIATIHRSDPAANIASVEIPAAADEFPAKAVMRRYGFSAAPAAISLQPMLADRPVVVSPESPLMLPSDEEITLYVSTPAWVEISIGDPPNPVLEVPLLRPSDTWFGPSTMYGELCYAVRTSARLKLENLPVRPHRIVSTVRITNHGNTNLAFERMKIPALQMSVYSAADGQLWTQTVNLERYEDQRTATVRLGSGPPPQAVDPALLHGPRLVAEKNLLTSAFSGLIPWG